MCEAASSASSKLRTRPPLFFVIANSEEKKLARITIPPHYLGVGRSFASNAAGFHAVGAVRLAGAANARLHHSLQEVHAANDEPNHAHVLHHNEQDH